MSDRVLRKTVISLIIASIATAPLFLLHGNAFAASASPPWSMQENVQYGTADGVNLLMDVYTPTHGSAPFPAIVLLHAGGFYKGDKSDPDVVRVSHILAAVGYVVFNTNYRLAPQYPFPAAVDDVQQAVLFVRQDADRFRIDPARIGIAGASAGSTIGAWVAYVGTGPLDTGSRVAAVVTWSGPFDLPAVLNEGRDLGSNTANGWLTPGPDLLQEAIRASPITYVDPSDPPILMMNAAHEQSSLDQPERMKVALEKVGVPAQIHVLRGGNHALGGSNFAPDVFYGLLFFDKELEHSSFGTLKFNLLQPLPHDRPIVRALFWIAMAALLIWALVSALRPRPART